MPSIPPMPYQFSDVQSRSISPGNPTGARGGAYKAILHSGGSPGDEYTKHAVKVRPDSVLTLVDISPDMHI